MNYPSFKEEVIEYLKDYPEDLMKAPKSVSQDFDILKSVIEYNGAYIQYVIPNTPRYNDLCKIAVSKSAYTLHYVPENLRTEELCKFAVSKNGGALRAVPEKLKTLEICKIAISQDSRVLYYVPDHLKDKVKQELNIQESLDFTYFQNL